MFQNLPSHDLGDSKIDLPVGDCGICLHLGKIPPRDMRSIVEDQMDTHSLPPPPRVNMSV
jgi:hypothetical protein